VRRIINHRELEHLFENVHEHGRRASGATAVARLGRFRCNAVSELSGCIEAASHDSCGRIYHATMLMPADNLDRVKGHYIGPRYDVSSDEGVRTQATPMLSSFSEATPGIVCRDIDGFVRGGISRDKRRSSGRFSANQVSTTPLPDLPRAGETSIQTFLSAVKRTALRRMKLD
jgi:hypothetical protein